MYSNILVYIVLSCSSVYLLTTDHHLLSSRHNVQDMVKELKEYLYKLNEEKKQQIIGHCEAIIYNAIAGIRYHFLADDGPKYQEVSEKTPIMTRHVIYSF